MHQPNPSAEELFLAALELEGPEARATFLDLHCGDPALRRLVEELLACDKESGDFLETPALGPAGAVSRDTRPAAGEPEAAIGPFRLLEAIGEGGMGTVYLAEQAEPVRRRVALKVVKTGMHSEQVAARLEAERQALALMDHPNIARVFDGGVTASGRPYFVMELVVGPTITGYCDRERLPVRERLALFVQVCRAVQHAHQKGVIHRDLKPSNVLVTIVDGVAVPKVIDFGVAKPTGQALTDKAVNTLQYQIVGTPLYMSPEQADPGGSDVDTRSDIYSLGVLLYELLTGTTPFDPESLRAVPLDAMRRTIREVDPAAPGVRVASLGPALVKVSELRRTDPRRLPVLLRGDLDAVVMKALEKDRRRRYEAASDLAADVTNYLAGLPVTARRVTRVERAVRYCRRHPAAVGFGATLAASVAAVGGVLVAWALSADAANSRLHRALDEANHQRALQMGYWAETRAAGGDPAALLVQSRALGLLAVPDPVAERRIRHEFAVCEAVSHPLAAVLEVPHPVYAAAVSPDGRSVAFGGDGVVFLRDLRAGGLERLDRHAGRVRCLGFSPDSRLLATGGDDGRVVVAPVGRPNDAPVQYSHPRAVLALAFSPDGERLLTGAADKVARLWRVGGGGTPLEITGHGDAVTSVAFAGRDFKLLVTGSGQGDKKARVWRERDVSQPLHTWPHGGAVSSLAVSNDGGLVLTCSTDLKARLWSAEDGRLVRPPLQHDSEVVAAVFGRDGLLAWTGNADSEVHTWDLRGTARRPKLTTSDKIVGLGKTDDGRLLFACGADGRAALWDVGVPDVVGTLPLDSGLRFVLSLDRRWLLSHDRRSITVWAVPPDGRSGRRLEWPSPIQAVAAGGGDDAFLVAAEDGSVRSVDTRLDHRPAGPAEATTSVGALAGHRSGYALLGYADGTVQLLRRDQGTIGPPMQQEGGAVTSLAFSGDGRRFAVGTRGGLFRVWKTDLTPVLDANYGVPVTALTMNQDGTLLVVGGDDGKVRMLDVEARASHGPRLPIGSAVRGLSFFADGTAFAALDDSGTVRLLSRGLEFVGPPIEPPVPVTWSELTADGAAVAHQTGSGQFLLSPLPRPSPTPVKELAAAASLRTGLKLGGEGQVLYVGEAEWQRMRERARPQAGPAVSAPLTEDRVSPEPPRARP